MEYYALAQTVLPIASAWASDADSPPALNPEPSLDPPSVALGFPRQLLCLFKIYENASSAQHVPLFAR